MARRSNIGSSSMGSQQIDQDVKAMLRKSQPGHFSGEGDNVGEQLEEWFEKMEEYFSLAHSSEENKAMMGHFKLEKSAKLWWKDHCKENALDPGNMTWDYLSTQLAKSYQTCTYHIDRVNGFLDSVQGKDSLDLLYQRFLKLMKYAPVGMDREAKVARFVSKLNPPLDMHLQSLRLTTFSDVLDAGRPIEQEIAKLTQKEAKTPPSKESAPKEVVSKKRGPESSHPRGPEPRQRLPNHLFEKARREHLCLGCLDPSHHIKDCPYVRPAAGQGNGPNYARNDGQRLYQGMNPNHIPLRNNRNFNQRPSGAGNKQGGNRQNPPHP